MNRKDEEFFNQILLELSHSVESMIKHVCNDPELAEDVMQDIFLEAYQNISKLSVNENYREQILLMAKRKLQARLPVKMSPENGE